MKIYGWDDLGQCEASCWRHGLMRVTWASVLILLLANWAGKERLPALVKRVPLCCKRCSRQELMLS